MYKYETFTSKNTPRKMNESVFRINNKTYYKCLTHNFSLFYNQ